MSEYSLPDNSEKDNATVDMIETTGPRMVDISTPASEACQAGLNRIDNEVNALKASLEGMDKNTGEYKNTLSAIDDFERAKSLILGLSSELPDQSAGELAIALSDKISRFERELEESRDELQSVTPDRIRWAGVRVIDGPSTSERRVVEEAREKYNEAEKQFRAVKLANQYLPMVTAKAA